jgi:hypothetical protein
LSAHWNGYRKQLLIWTQGYATLSSCSAAFGLLAQTVAAAAPPLPRISAEEDCWVAIEPADAAQGNDPLRVYVRKKPGGSASQFAVLERRADRTSTWPGATDTPAESESDGDLDVDVSEREALEQPSDAVNPFPYQVTGGDILKNGNGTCQKLVGMVAVPTHRDPFLKAAQKTATLETPAADPKPRATKGPKEGRQTDEPTDTPQTEASSPEDPPVETEAEPTSPPFVTIIGAVGAEMNQLQGLYIDANTDTSLLFFGPHLRIALAPLALFTDSIYGTGFQLTYAYQSGESTQNLQIRRNDKIVGTQESSVVRQDFRIGYGLSYLNDTMSSRADLYWANQKLRHAARFDPGIEGDGSSLRDLETTCLGMRITQTYSLENLFTVNASLGYCLSSEAETPAITVADFPNARTDFQDSNEADFDLGLSVPIGDRSPVSFTSTLTVRRWAGSLLLSEGAVIDSQSTQFGFALGFTQTL